MSPASSCRLPPSISLVYLVPAKETEPVVALSSMPESSSISLTSSSAAGGIVKRRSKGSGMTTSEQHRSAALDFARRRAQRMEHASRVIATRESEALLGQREAEKKLQNAHLTRATLLLHQQDKRRQEREQKTRERLLRRQADIERQQSLLHLQQMERSAAESTRQKKFQDRKQLTSLASHREVNGSSCLRSNGNAVLSSGNLVRTRSAPERTESETMSMPSEHHCLSGALRQTQLTPSPMPLQICGQQSIALPIANAKSTRSCDSLLVDS